MECTGIMDPVEDREEAAGPAQRPVSEAQNTVLYTVLSTEEVDSSIREFSYIWSSGAFDIGEPDTDRLGDGDGSCHIAIFKIETDNPESTQQRHTEEFQPDEPQESLGHGTLEMLPASCYSAQKEEPRPSSIRSHRRDSSSVYTRIPHYSTEADANFPPPRLESQAYDGSANDLPARDDASAKYSDCLQGGQSYCDDRHEPTDAAPRSENMTTTQFVDDISYWQNTSRGVQSSDIPRFQVDLPLPRSRSVGRRFIAKMKFWKQPTQEIPNSKPQSYMSHSKRSITASIASSWSRKAKGYIKKPVWKDTEPRKMGKSSQQSIRTVSPKSIFSRAQKSPVSNYSDFLTELHSDDFRGRVTSPRPETHVSAASKELPTLDLDIHISLGEPRPFQCTFCLMQWDNKEEWTYHEASFHMRPYGNLYPQAAPEDTQSDMMFSMSDIEISTQAVEGHQAPVNSPEAQKDEFISLGYHLYTQGHHEEPKKPESWNWLEKRSNWFWNCGFCELILRTWAERQEHIAEHFEHGTTLISWDPLRSPYPMSKFTLTPVEGFPPWDFSPLHSLQQPGLQDEVYRASTCPPEHKCDVCRKHFPNLDAATQHHDLWHRTPESWVCPGPEHASNPGVFFDTEQVTADASDLASLNLEEHMDLETDFEKTVYTYDYCLCCGEIFHESPPDWEARKQHLRDMHCISETSEVTYDHTHNHGQRFHREELFSLHLANCHNVRLDYLTEFTEFCRKKAQAPVLMVQQSRPLEG